jgi:hypothetical protein
LSDILTGPSRVRYTERVMRTYRGKMWMCNPIGVGPQGCSRCSWSGCRGDFAPE